MGYWDTAGQSDEWYTPPGVFRALGCQFDLDVAPARYGTPEGARRWLEEQNAADEEDYRCDLAAYQALSEKERAGKVPPKPFVPRPIPDNLTGGDHVPARGRLAGDGLTEPYSGFIWCNPPFGGRNAIEPWLNRFLDHGNGIALTPDRTSAPWFRRAWPRATLILFTPKIRFLRPDGTEGVSPSNGTALWAVGSAGQQALRRAAAAGFGISAQPIISTILDRSAA